MPKLKINALLKFGDEKNMVDLYENGTLYFNTVEYFRDLEDKQLRGDKYEGKIFISNIKNSNVFLLGGKEEKLFGTADLVHVNGSSKGPLGNLYSMYTINSANLSDEGMLKIDEKVIDFGSHFVGIHGKDIFTFFNKVNKALIKNNIEYTGNLVEYYDEEIDIFKQLDFFKKRKIFSFQNEFRLFIPSYDIKPFSIKIGNMSSFATIHKTVSIFEENNYL